MSDYTIEKHDECEQCQVYRRGKDCEGRWTYHHQNGEVREGACEPRRAFMEREKSERLFASSKLSPRFKARTFDTYTPNADTVKAYDACQKWAATSDHQGMGLLLNGPVGTGKTHLAAAILNAWLNMGKLGVFVVVSDLFGEIRAAMGNKDESSDEIIERVADLPLLILDDLGIDRSSEWQVSTIFRIVNHRYEHFLPTIITTNLTSEAIRDKFGMRIYDRLLECCEWVEVGGGSHREKLAKERLL